MSHGSQVQVQLTVQMQPPPVLHNSGSQTCLQVLLLKKCDLMSASFPGTLSLFTCRVPKEASRCRGVLLSKHVTKANLHRSQPHRGIA